MKPKTNQLLQKVQLDFLQIKNKEYTIQLLLIPLTISLTIITGAFHLSFLREVDVDELCRLIKNETGKSGSVHSSQNNLHRKDSIASHTQSLYQRNDDWAQRQPWKQSLSSLHSVQSNHDYPDPYNRCYPKENVFPKEIPVPPPDVAKLLAPKRRVTLNRRSDRGFGFSLRRSTISERCQTRRTVLFAEPGRDSWTGQDWPVIGR